MLFWLTTPLQQRDHGPTQRSPAKAVMDGQAPVPRAAHIRLHYHRIVPTSSIHGGRIVNLAVTQPPGHRQGLHPR